MNQVVRHQLRLYSIKNLFINKLNLNFNFNLFNIQSKSRQKKLFMDKFVNNKTRYKTSLA